jgi:hypothetical protein
MLGRIEARGERTRRPFGHFEGNLLGAPVYAGLAAFKQTYPQSGAQFSGVSEGHELHFPVEKLAVCAPVAAAKRPSGLGNFFSALIARHRIPT